MKTLAVLAAENKIDNHATSSPGFSVKLELTLYADGDLYPNLINKPLL